MCHRAVNYFKSYTAEPKVPNTLRFFGNIYVRRLF